MKEHNKKNVFITFLTKMRILLTFLFITSIISCESGEISTTALEWPPINRECKPWTYWWWHGSAVDKTNITKNLVEYSEAGIGGVHIIPIYGVKGMESSSIPYLSPKWMDMLSHTAGEAVRLGMGIDMTTGTGWPFGGPQVTADDASSEVLIETFPFSGGERFRRSFSRHNLQALMAFTENREVIDIFDNVDNNTGNIDWKTPESDGIIYAVSMKGTGQQVKRAAPGAEGNVLDYFSQEALGRYLEKFDRAFDSFGKTIPIRTFYNDSYEVYRCNWTDDLFEEFIRLRAYDLRNFLPELAGEGSPDLRARIIHDYNETISDLLLDQFTNPWVQWAHQKGSFTRSQAHGSPGNLLDLYAAADIPETEAFGTSRFPIPGLRIDKDMPEHFGKPDNLVMKFASSAAHVTGKKYVSSESCTWLGEHFNVALSQVKPEIDALFVSGINHVYFHGIAYSPKEAAWPGWLFYASTNFGQSNPFWHDLPELNAYIARCQSFLQSGKPANDLLLYWPVHNLWRNEADEDRLHHFQVHNADEWLYGTPFHTTAKTLWEKGYTFDYTSDSFLSDMTASAGMIETNGVFYKAIIVPGCRYMPVDTLEKLIALAHSGAVVLVVGSLPEDVPGLSNIEIERSRFSELIADLGPGTKDSRGFVTYETGKGSVYVGEQLEQLIGMADAAREPVVDHGIEFIRMSHDNGFHYFLTNPGSETLDGWISLGVSAKSAVMFDPLTNAAGCVSVRKNGQGGSQVYLQLEPGQSCILRTFTSAIIREPEWNYLSIDGEPHEITGQWDIVFREGGPVLPSGISTDKPAYWTELADDDARVFAGTARYTVSFYKPQDKADEWVLDLGTVKESARIWLNGEYAGASWCFPFKLRVGNKLKEGENILEVDITNLAANRIADMDRRHLPWKIFQDINFVSIKYEPFDASSWPVMDSGLSGP
ncbi:glycosyl hydrolase, partial [Candidatus Omnitrophota bacterium]